MPAGSEIRRGLEVLVAPGQVFEVRSWTGDRISSGYFDDLDAAEKAITALDAANPDGIYLTPNPVLPDLLARRANRIKGPLSKKDSSTSDGDILGRRWFLIDIDPERPSGVSSSEEEHRAALERAADIATALGEMGWPAPVAGDSGNGAHLLYRLDLPNDEKVTALIRAALVASSLTRRPPSTRRSSMPPGSGRSTGPSRGRGTIPNPGRTGGAGSSRCRTGSGL